MIAFVWTVCYCFKSKREVACTENTHNVKKFECGEICEMPINCGIHQCQDLCHPGQCKPCELAVDLVKTCHCGKTELEKIYERDGIDPRKNCGDPIPTCHLTCGKRLECGPPSNRHVCQALCHEGPCPTCPQTTLVKCRCGFMNKEVRIYSLKIFRTRLIWCFISDSMWRVEDSSRWC